ncbi:MAG: starch-binding protein [Bacteroides sp.]|nr:starch-binding protein [Bacteroides sp.]
MKRLTKYFSRRRATLPLFGSLLTLLATGCADDLDFNRTVALPQGTVLRIPNPGGTASRTTRTGDNDSQIALMENEGRISSLHLFAFDPTTRQLKKSIDLAEAVPADGHLNTHDSHVDYSLAQLLPEGSYHLYLVANLDSYASGWSSPADEDALKDTILDFLDSDGASILMSSSSDDVPALPMACLSSEMDFTGADNTTGNVGQGTVTIEKNKQAIVHADLRFLCAKMRFTILFDASPEGHSASVFGDNRLTLTGATLTDVNHGCTKVSGAATSTDESFSDCAISLSGVEYPGNPATYPTEEQRFVPLPSITPSGDTRAWQGTVYIPENLDSDRRTTLRLTATLDGIDGQELTYELPLVPADDANEELTGIERARAYDITASVTGLHTLRTNMVVVNPWTSQTLNYTISDNVYLDIDATRIESLQAGEEVSIGYSTNAADGLRWDSPKYLTPDGEEIDVFDFETRGGRVYISVNPGLKSEYYPALRDDIDRYRRFHLVAGKIYKAVEIDDLVLNRYMNVTPNVITVGVREIVSSMQYEGSFDIDIESNIGQINLTSANWTSGNDPLYLEIVKPDGSAVAVTVPATFSMESDYPDGELKLRVHYTDLNTSNIDFWDTSHTGSGAFKLRLGVDNEGFTGDDYVNPSTVTVNTVASNDNYIIHFKPGAPWSRAGTDAVQPHIYIYQCLAMPANLTAITGNEYDAQFASKTVGYYDYGMKAALEYSFTGKIAFKGWDNESNLTALKGTKSMDGGFVKLESAKLNIKDNDAANHYYFDYDFMDSYRNGKDIYGHYKCDCENCRKEYANQPGEDNGYNRMWPGIMMEKEPGTDGWWKIELTGIADPGKTLMMWRDGHAMNDGNNGDWAHNRYPKDNEPGVPLFDYPSREGWFDWESKTFLPENPDNRPYDWKSTAVNGMGRIYFENPSGWNPPYVHYWGGASNSSWPGKAMQQDGNGNWYYDIPIGTTGLVFSNNGNNQTPDIDINDEYNTYNSTEATKVTSK